MFHMWEVILSHRCRAEISRTAPALQSSPAAHRIQGSIWFLFQQNDKWLHAMDLWSHWVVEMPNLEPLSTGAGSMAGDFFPCSSWSRPSFLGPPLLLQLGFMAVDTAWMLPQVRFRIIVTRREGRWGQLGRGHSGDLTPGKVSFIQPSAGYSSIPCIILYTFLCALTNAFLKVNFPVISNTLAFKFSFSHWIY